MEIKQVKKDNTIPTKLWIASLNRGKEIREGQAIMNELHNLDSVMYDIITNGQFDCFYDDSKIPSLVEYLSKVYNDSTNN